MMLVVVVGLVGLLFPWSVNAQTYKGRTYHPVELSFLSTIPYAHPHRDVRLEVDLTGPDGQMLRVAGFWDGK